MNVRVTTFLAYEGEDGSELQEIVGDFCESLVARGYGNILGEDEKTIKSMVLIHENVEIAELGADQFFSDYLQGAIFQAFPAEEYIEGENEDARGNDTDS